MTGVLIRTMLLIVSFALSIITTEGVLRIIGYEDARLLYSPELPTVAQMYLPDDEVIYRLVYHPNNSAGAPLALRPDKRINSDQTPQTFTILEIGDSSTFGHNLPDADTYPNQLEELLLEKGFDVNVFNAGVSGYGVDQEYIQTLNAVDSIKPSLVVLNIHENDIQDANENCLFVKQGTGYNRVSAKTSTIYLQSTVGLTLPRVIATSHLYNILLQGTGLNKRKNFACTRPNGATTDAAMVEKTAWLLADLKKNLHDRGIGLLLTFVPVQRYFDPKDPYTGPMSLFRQQIIDAARTWDVMILDTNELLAHQYAPEIVQTFPSLWFNSDKDEPLANYGWKHSNREGNREYAKLVAREIEENYTTALRGAQTSLTDPGQ